jgi:hypothetical protein
MILNLISKKNEFIKSTLFQVYEYIIKSIEIANHIHESIESSIKPVKWDNKLNEDECIVNS